MSSDLQYLDSTLIDTSEVFYHQHSADIKPLSVRELEVLQLIVDGHNNSAIGRKLYISVGTVKTHVRSVLRKLCVEDRTQAAIRALRSGLIH